MMRLESALTVLAVAKLSVAKAINVNGSFLALSANEITPHTLQDALEEKCRVEATLACNQGLEHYCDANIYARKDTGTESQNTKEWRCYHETSLELHSVGPGCVDNCGNPAMCTGVRKGAKPDHLSRVKLLQGEIDSKKETYCNRAPLSLEEALEQKCRSYAQEACKAGDETMCNVALYVRWGLGDQGNEKKWRCYIASELNFEVSGKNCIDDCGKNTFCPGVADENVPAHRIRNSDLWSLIKEERNLYCNIGARTLQDLLDKECNEWAESFCEDGQNVNCDKHFYARFDVGTDKQRTRQWRCFAPSSIDFTKEGDGCVDNCGKITTCHGAVISTSKEHYTRHAALQDVIKEHMNAYCNA